MDQTDNQLPPLDLLGFLIRILRRGRRLWVWGVVFVSLGAGIACAAGKMRYTPVYEASVSFTVSVANPLYSDIRIYNTKTAEQMASTFPYILTSTALQQRVKEHLGISDMPQVSASVISNSNIFALSVQDTDPQHAYDVLHGIIANYPEIAEFVVGPTRLIELDSSGIPTVPVHAFRMYRVLVMGGVAGFVLWFAVCLLYSATRTTIHNEGELKKLLNLPCYSNIPNTKVVGKKLTCPLVTKDRGKVGFGEAVRMLRMRTDREMSQSGKKVLMVSSARPGEGKTTVSVNLAISLVQIGKKVLIIDCDMYNPSVAKALQSRFGRGISKLPLGNSGQTASLHGIAMTNLYTVVFSGQNGKAPRQINAAELEQLIKYTKNAFDYVILDTPPCSLLADTAELAEVADCGILVIRQDYASREQILDCARLLTDSGLPLIGCVMNGIESKLGPGGYKYGYGYGYGYSYGQNEGKE